MELIGVLVGIVLVQLALWAWLVDAGRRCPWCGQRRGIRVVGALTGRCLGCGSRM